MLVLLKEPGECWLYIVLLLPSYTSVDGEQDGTAGSMDASTQGLLEGIGLDGDTLAPMETDEPTTSDSKGKSKITPAMAARIKQIKPLLSGESFSFLLPFLAFSPLVLKQIDLERLCCFI